MKRAVKIIFCILYCVLGVYCILLDLGFPRVRFKWDPFVYYTSLSNMLCTGFTFLALIFSFFSKRDFAPRVKFAFSVMIAITAIVYNLLLNGYTSLAAYFAATKNGLYHLLLPLAFCLDWLLLYDRGKVKATDPLLAAGLPLAYVVYILIRAEVVLKIGRYVRVRYPYFFLNVDILGWDGLAMWLGALLIGVLALGYVLYTLDRLLSRRPRSRVSAP